MLMLRPLSKVQNLILPFISDDIDQEISKLKKNITELQKDIQQEVSDREEGYDILNGNNRKNLNMNYVVNYKTHSFIAYS